MRSVVQAWADAKTRTGRTDLLVTVKQGQYRLKSIEFDARGHAKTTPITGFMTPADISELCAALQLFPLRAEGGSFPGMLSAAKGGDDMTAGLFAMTLDMCPTQTEESCSRC